MRALLPVIELYNEEANANAILWTETFTISISINVTLGDNDYAHNQPKNLSRVRF